MSLQHVRQQQYVHYSSPAQPQTVSPQDTQHTKTVVVTVPRTQPHASTSTSSGAAAGGNGAPAPVVAKGNWTKDLVQLAKTAELKKHALTLQLHTAHILSAHASLEQKNRAIQDVREQKFKLDNERNRLLECLRQINEDRDKADLLEAGINADCTTLRNKIATLTAGEYAAAKADVDRLRADLGQPPLPSLQSTLDEKGAQYLTDRRVGATPAPSGAVPPPAAAAGAPEPKKRKRAANSSNNNNNNNNGAGVGGASSGGNGGDGNNGGEGAPVKRPRGRPRGSRNGVAGAAGVGVGVGVGG